MSNPTGDDSCQDEEEREGELLCFRIKAPLEDLFSDSHLAEDGFLLKHVQKNKEGYVSLKLLTCLKKIKALTTNWHMTLAAAESSDLLEVNAEGTKVRRIKPLPKWLLCSPTSRLLLAWNFSEEQSGEDGAAQDQNHLSLSERILHKFSTHRGVTSVYILHPGKELPKELQCYAKRHKELGQHLCAVVKFVNFETIRKAYNVLKAEEEKSNGRGMRVVPLGFHSMHHITKDKSPEEKSEHDSEDTLSQENPLENSGDSVQEEQHSSPVKFSDKTPDTNHPQSTLNKSVGRTFELISASCNSRSLSGLNERVSTMSWCSGDCDKESVQSPWVMRRRFAASALKPTAPGHPNAPNLMQRILRQPFGPDGTKGFQGRSKKEEIKLSPGWRRTTCAELPWQICGATTYYTQN
ncbi:la-related protein 6-like [Toxotes jaculatrix]|uniref:la-related protein 6-like n=1 Tax=Toxotes jaculatrix TaxID=941984 RepID=UPI001B3AA8E8|nr:la-related protein 6-like [Toxotes jaculatrix]